MSIPRPLTAKHTKANVLGDNLTIILFGHTGSGKTAQIGELAEYYFKNFKLKTRLYSADKGGWITIKPYVNLGVIDVVPLFGDVWTWINHAIKGDKVVDGNWMAGTDDNIGMYAFEGMTSMSDSLMSWMSDAAGKGVNIGGGGSFKFTAGDGKDKVTIGSNNMAHYSVAQQQVFEKSTQSQYLPGTVLWTAGDRRGEDDAVGGVVGPQVAGKALTGEVLRWFKYGFRLSSEVLPGTPPKHLLHMDWHTEMQSKGMAKGMANSRVPLAGENEQTKIPSVLEPASLVRALELLNSRQDSAEAAIKARLGL